MRRLRLPAVLVATLALTGCAVTPLSIAPTAAKTTATVVDAASTGTSLADVMSGMAAVVVAALALALGARILNRTSSKG